MEPVPETERMEEFRSSPLPSLRLSPTTALGAHEPDILRKPPTVRRSTDPPSPPPISPSWMPPALPYRPRASSPLSSSHVRSRSAASLAPPMARTQSMPSTNATGHLLYSPHIRPQSPSGTPSRIRLPRKPVDETFPSSPTRISIFDHERKTPEGSSSPNLAMGITPLASVPKLRRPSSPLCQVSHAPTTPSSLATSPSHRPYDSLSGGNYGYSGTYPSSSVPSTPTSARSRSPSISSLETIPDSPDAEEAALEAERIAQLKAAADAADAGDTKGRSSLDVPIRGRTLSGFSSRDKRKRWSVCGAERRQDLDLETIWED
ncbi:hypothetical protein MYCTH_2053555 [Thermothelomyces thermophilus ATCC 42464]|uniref:Basic proline-rich protein n=1 Tax=Thermothelomyces thermophilus (strain ATCC 42464 / BCRC 31852 / DSM 1799) TaxID=573729 RepID=G2Q099_THET4|nr:uncharacterized protein MYCTH_2053555 [Thermothelomyces thermophilus ATCC 42464]AEO53162.1 hypothetical protein MYCTH_2053555 [Thermothelomyces thermophilus ATCC 42464]